MKIAALHLLAFGPFTDKSITLDDGPANLHLIYGPNEAGKSSALRAMSELRFGIQLRTTDNFLHPNDRLLVGGAFIDAAGQRVEVLRSKGRNKTLSYMDPATRQADPSRPMSNEHETALTGGLSRTDFAAMFGLNHERLREGGKQLLRGDGELGAALFEASAGSRGIAGLLGTLEEDAKKLFNPRGNVKNATLNEAAKQFEEARRAYREALIKPADWQQRKRAHDEARAALDGLHEALATERRRLNELTELRTVEPLLRQLDASAGDLAELHGVPMLAESARDERLAAEPALERAQHDADDAAALVNDSRRALAGITVDETLIRHAAAVERFVAGALAGARSRVDVMKLQAGIDRIDAELQAGARRIAGKGALPADVLAAVPSHAEQRALSAHLAALDDLAVQVRMLRQQTADASDQLAQAAESRAESMPDAGLRAALLEALSRAQALGDAEQRLRDNDRQRRELSMQLTQTISDLEMTVMLVESLEGGPPATQVQAARAEVAQKEDLSARLRVYRFARPLLSAEIEAVRLSNNLRDELHRKVTHDLETLQRDIDTQRRRLVSLSAAGEVVTADMLKATRARRDEMWLHIRAAYLDVGAGAGAGVEVHVASGKVAGLAAASVASAALAGPVSLAFEAVQTDADRHADLLRADAERAAVFEECRLRIEQMLQRQTDMASIEKRLGIDERVAMQAWSEQLREAGLPVSLNPTALHEWQVLRSGLLEKADRLAVLQSDRDLMLAAIANAARALAAALEGITPDMAAYGPGPVASVRVGAMPMDAAADMVEMSQLMRRAVAWEAAAVKQAADFEARSAALAAQRQALAKGRASIAQAEAQIREHRQAVADWLQRAFLHEGSSPEICRSRLAELIDLQALADEAAAHTQRRREQAAIGDEILSQAAHVAALIGDETPSLAALQDYADQLGARLRQNLQADGERQQLLRDAARGEQARRAALLVAARQAAVLERLCAAAGVSRAQQLPAVEEAAARKRRIVSEIDRQQALLARASARPLAALRQRLDGADSVALDADIARCRVLIDELETQHVAASHAQEQARAGLESIDSSDKAAEWRERMEQAGARVRAQVLPWARLRLAHALLQESLRRFRDRAQVPMVQAASRYFSLMTGGVYPRLMATDDDDKPVLQAERAGGARIAIEAMSEGTGDQLYLALRLAALELRRHSNPAMPLVLDDVLITSDDERAANILKALADFAEGTQVLIFTHHRHVLDVGRATLGADRLAIHEL